MLISNVIWENGLGWVPQQRHRASWLLSRLAVSVGKGITGAMGRLELRGVR